MPSTIIVGADGAKDMDRVLDAAAALAQRLSADIVLVTAIEGGEDAKTIEDVAAHRLGKVTEHVVQHGAAWRVLCDVAKRRSATALVVGARNATSLERALGTTAAHVVNHAETPVLVVRGPLSFERVLVAHDGSKRAPAVLASALRFLAPGDGRLVLVRAVEPIFRAPFGPTIDPTEIAKLVSEDVAATAPRDRTDVQVHLGIAWEVVLAAAKAADAGLVVIGSHGFQPIDRVLGTTAARVVDHADRCVLVVKGEALTAGDARVNVASAPASAAR